MRALWRHRDARIYILGQLVSVFGDTSMWLALGIWVKLVTGSSSAAGLVFFVYALLALFAPGAGYIVDRVRRRRLLIVVNLLSALIVLPLLAADGRRQLWIVYVVIALYGLSGTFISSAQSAFLTVLAPAELLPDANAMLQTGREALRLLSPLLGAGVVAAVGNVTPLVWFDAASFLIAAGCLVAVRVPESRPQRSAERWWGEMTAGVRHVWRTVPLRQIVLATAAALLVVGFTETLIFSVVQRGLHRSPSFVGVLVSLQGVGAIGGGLTAARAIRTLGDGRTLAVGLALFGGAEALLIPSSTVTAVLAVLVGGFGLPWAIVAVMLAVQLRTPAALQGRSAAAADVLMTVPQTLSIGLGAALVLVVDYRILLAVTAVTIVIAAAWLATRPEQRLAVSAEDVALALRAEPPPFGEGLAGADPAP